jgi:beta-N-acetylhexosaminidase
MTVSHAPVILDIAGARLDAADRRRLKHPLVGGLILFARNWESRRQLVELTAEIKALREDLLICVDHEGGRVQRFRGDGFTALPPMRVLGEMWMQDALAATAVGAVLGAELRACGVDLSFTPVLDLDHGASQVIGDRAFHRDPRVVTLLAKSLMLGLLRAGMAHCGKHFPGHGHVAADSHHETPIDRRGKRAILGDDARPYEWLSTSLTAMNMLRAKLAEKAERERQEEIAREKGEVQDVNFGSQIRSYVLHPYTMVKDHRTTVEMGDAQRVLDGDLDRFVRAELLRRAGLER